MKKIILLLLTGAMILGLTGCSNTKKTTTKEITGTLEEIMEKIYSDTQVEFPMLAITEINSENAEYFLGVNDLDYEQAIASEPVRSSQAHCVVLLRASKDADIDDIKEKIKENVNGRKWICVEVEDKNIIVDNIGNLVILIMDDESKAIQESFSNLANKTKE